MNKRDVEFLFEIGSIRNVPRGWQQHIVHGVANNTEHSFRVVFIALAIARSEGGNFDEGKIIKMALMHDLVESRTTDLSYVQKIYCKPDEDKSAVHMTEGTQFEDFLEIFREYEKRDCIEAKIVKDADNMDIDFEFRELEEQGSKLPKKWKGFRKLIREEKLYTESAKKMWDMLQDADPSDWHMKANKWVHDPNAGK